MDYIFLGPPGCGKGTQSEYLRSDPNYAHISTGDLLRACSVGEDSVCKRINIVLSEGKMLEDELVIELVEKSVAKHGNKVIVFDGFPRTLNQANLLDVMFEKENRELGKVIYFEIADSELLDRIVNRLMCPNCGRIYNKLSNTPKVKGECDDCKGVKLTQRKDDDASVLQERLKNFHDLTAPLIRHYDDRGLLVRVDARQSESSVREAITKILK